MTPFDYKLLLIRLLPETILVIGALIALFLDQAEAKPRKSESRSLVAGIIATLTIVLAGIAAWQTTPGSFYGGVLVVTEFTKLVRLCLLALVLTTILIGAPSKFTVHIGEYVALVLLATVGLILLVATEELLTAFISLELVSLSLYLLTAFNKHNINSAEAALKYFLFGSVAAAFTLFGISLIFGLGGSTGFGVIAAGLRNSELNPLLITGIVLMAIGFAFKMAAAPLHLWAPDAYQGAPVPSAALIASASKLASLVLFLKFFVLALPAQAGSAAAQSPIRGWTMTIATISAASMIFGNLLAIAQSNFRRLIAYSAVAHAGYALVAVLARNENGAASAVYYMFTYGLTVVGIFGIVGLVEERHGELTIAEFAGLSRRAPALALPLFVFILSLAGIPPLAGFFGKFYVFLAALDFSRTSAAPGLLWLVVLAIAASAVSLYYYLSVLKQVFVAEGGSRNPIPSAPLQTGAILLLAGAVILFGCLPNLLVEPLRKSLAAQVEPEPAARIFRVAPPLAIEK